MNHPNRRSKHLPHAEQIALAGRAKDGDVDARHLLVESNIRFISTQAQRFVRRTHLLELGDYIAVGVIGLLQAVEKFDPERGTTFLTYARYWVRLRMKELLVRTVIRISGPTDILSMAWSDRYAKDRQALAKQDLSADDEDKAVATSHGMSHSTLLAAESLATAAPPPWTDHSTSPPTSRSTTSSRQPMFGGGGAGDEEKLAYCRTVIANYAITLPFTRRVILRGNACWRGSRWRT